MMENKEKNFISAVVYLPGCDDAATFFERLDRELDEHFAQYELIAVDDCCAAGTVEQLRRFAEKLEKPLTILHMSVAQGLEPCMNAGLDAAIGDYVYEFDFASARQPVELLWQAYCTAMEGNDIVSACPSHAAATSRLFYRVFNANSRSAYALRTDAFRLVSRRAVNRVHAISANLPYRKAAYAACGLKMATLDFEGSAPTRRGGRMGLALDSLALYTDAGWKLSIGITLVMLAVTLAELIYTLVFYLAGGHPIEGWTTTMFVLTFGFTGVFAVLAMVLKYLSLLLEVTFKNQKYLVEGIEKIQK